jgi:hypothetical protein
LLFQLHEDEEGWPPVAVEGLWCEPLDGLYRVQTCPLFVKGLSIGDLIEVQQDAQHEVAAFTVVQPSGNSTVWVIFWVEPIDEPTLHQLRSAGCETIGPLGGWKTALCSVNVPAEVSFGEVDAILQPLEESGRASAAHPLHRHND